MRTVPSAAEMLADIETILGFGIRRPGHPGDRQAEEWAAARFAELGLQDAGLEPVELPMWESAGATLDVWPAGDPAAVVRYAGFAPPYTDSCADLERDLIPFDAATARDQIVVEPLAFTELPQSMVREQATSVFDPDGEFDTLVQTLPFGPRLNLVLDPAVEAGAAGYVGILTGVPWETCQYYVPYDTQPRALSGLWLSRADGMRLQRLVADRPPYRGRLNVDGRRTRVRCHNVVGRLPGQGDETVIIGSHHDAPWASAVEDASGMALVLAQARYWAGQPEASRPHNLSFLLTAGHMAGGAGTRAFVQQHAEWLHQVVLQVHLEHAAAEVRGDGERLELTGQPEPRWWFTSTEPGLQAAVDGALRGEDLRRSFVLPPTVFGPAPPTDGSAFYLAGVPVVHFLTAPMYLFDPQDTIDKIHVPSLEPVSRAVIRIIESVAGRTAAQLRGGA
jgi:hypothetical protein